jgi:hypothetical protein
MFRFFQNAVRYARPINDAAREAFGASWTDVKRDCATYIQATVS